MARPHLLLVQQMVAAAVLLVRPEQMVLQVVAVL
jgi:hypothetical protein